MIFMAKLCLVILGVVLVIYIMCDIIYKKRTKSSHTNNKPIKIPFTHLNPSLIKTLEGECGAPNKPLRKGDISYNDNIKKYKEIQVEETCPEKNIIRAYK